ncbi:MAG: aminoacyl-histidine dipeptidase [Bacteroidales bacterium]|jgi:dipeptidase D|nr:aminoacyl-histidine dipeptidase [Bacteroidales bacterium]
MNDIRKLEPAEVWNYFSEICSIPHPSKKEQKLIAFMEEFGRKHNLATVVDKTGNIIIRKPATAGMENRPGVILQAHLDMVPQKNSSTEHNFETDPITPVIDGQWIKASGTTLGADNGIGMAAAMAILASTEIEHGPLEALFTVDEETGMTGVSGLEKGMLKGDMLMNLDSEDEGELFVGCAGGVDVSISKKYSEEKTPAGMAAFKVAVTGLRGGHSGCDIALGRANSNKLMFRFLMQAEPLFDARIAWCDGGGLRNAIPREANAVVTVQSGKSAAFIEFAMQCEETYREEFAETEPGLSLKITEAELPAGVMAVDDQRMIARAVFACPNGVQRMSRAMDGLVETSNNLAAVKCAGGKFEAHCLARSSVDSAKDTTASKIAAVFELVGATVNISGGYPGWKPNMQSAALATLAGVYESMFGSRPEVKAIHAGLECGMLGGKYPNLDMVSFGPTIRNPHSPDECVSVASVKKFWDFLVESLKNIPEKKC